MTSHHLTNTMVHSFAPPRADTLDPFKHEVAEHSSNMAHRSHQSHQSQSRVQKDFSAASPHTDAETRRLRPIFQRRWEQPKKLPPPRPPYSSQPSSCTRRHAQSTLPYKANHKRFRHGAKVQQHKHHDSAYLVHDNQQKGVR